MNRKLLLVLLSAMVITLGACGNNKDEGNGDVVDVLVTDEEAIISSEMNEAEIENDVAIDEIDQLPDSQEVVEVAEPEESHILTKDEMFKKILDYAIDRLKQEGGMPTPAYKKLEKKYAVIKRYFEGADDSIDFCVEYNTNSMLMTLSLAFGTDGKVLEENEKIELQVNHTDGVVSSIDAVYYGIDGHEEKREHFENDLRINDINLREYTIINTISREDIDLSHYKMIEQYEQDGYTVMLCEYSMGFELYSGNILKAAANYDYYTGVYNLSFYYEDGLERYHLDFYDSGDTIWESFVERNEYGLVSSAGDDVCAASYEYAFTDENIKTLPWKVFRNFREDACEYLY